jgi:hypothetical protein
MTSTGNALLIVVTALVVGILGGAVAYFAIDWSWLGTILVGIAAFLIAAAGMWYVNRIEAPARPIHH